MKFPHKQFFFQKNLLHRICVGIDASRIQRSGKELRRRDANIVDDWRRIVTTLRAEELAAHLGRNGAMHVLAQQHLEALLLLSF